MQIEPRKSTFSAQKLSKSLKNSKTAKKCGQLAAYNQDLPDVEARRLCCALVARSGIVYKIFALDALF
jgi:glutaminase